MAESTTKAPKGATANGDQGTAPTEAPKAMTTYIAFAWHKDGGWVPVPDTTGKQKQYKVLSGQGAKVQEQVLAELAAKDRSAVADDPEREPATSFRIAVVSERFWTDEEFEQEPPPPPQFKKRS